MYGFTEDFTTGIQRWRDPMGLVQNLREVPTLPVGTIVGVAAPLLLLLMLLGGGGRRRR